MTTVFMLIGVATTIYAIIRGAWWVVDKVPLIPGPMGSKCTLTYWWGWHSGRRR